MGNGGVKQEGEQMSAVGAVQAIDRVVGRKDHKRTGATTT
jgi:hypothetical protein